MMEKGENPTDSGQEGNRRSLRVTGEPGRDQSLLPKLGPYLKNSAISSSEKPTAFNLSLCSLFSSSLALRVRPLSAIASTK
jgi:hypothetical protein